MEGSVDPSVVIALTSKELMEGIELQETRDLNYTKAWSGAEASYEQEHVPGAKRRMKMPMRSVGGPDAPHSPADSLRSPASGTVSVGACSALPSPASGSVVRRRGRALPC